MVECWDTRDFQEFIDECNEQGLNIREEALKHMGIREGYVNDIRSTAF